MEERKASDTALSVAVLRVAHQLTGEEQRILDDPIIVRMLDESIRLHVQNHPEEYQTPHRRALLTNVLIRSRFAEERLAETVRHGVKQFVILGAGLDTFAYRQPGWAERLRIFEIDHFASQRAKHHRLEFGKISIPENLEYIQSDFEKEDLQSALSRSRFDFTEPAFFSCLDVLMYLTEKAVDGIFRFVAARPPSSEFVFTFANTGVESLIEKRAQAAGEPWLTKFESAELEQKLDGLGFSEIEFLTPQKIAERYIRDRHDGLIVPRHASIVRVKI